MTIEIFWLCVVVFVVTLVAAIYRFRAGVRERIVLEHKFNEYLRCFPNKAAQAFVANVEQFVTVKREGSHVMGATTGWNFGQGNFGTALLSAMIGETLNAHRERKLDRAVLGKEGKSQKQIDMEKDLQKLVKDAQGNQRSGPAYFVLALVSFVAAFFVYFQIEASSEPQSQSPVVTQSANHESTALHGEDLVGNEKPPFGPIVREELEDGQGSIAAAPSNEPMPLVLQAPEGSSEGLANVNKDSSYRQLEPSVQNVSHERLLLTNRDGREVYVSFLALTQSAVLVRLEDGQSIEIPLDSLTSDSVERIKLARVSKRNQN